MNREMRQTATEGRISRTNPFISSLLSLLEPDRYGFLSLRIILCAVCHSYQCPQHNTGLAQPARYLR